VKFVTPFLLATLCGCSVLSPQQVEHLATAQVTPDFETYTVHRVGLLPFKGRTLDFEHAEILQSAFYTEFSQQTPFEVVPLKHGDLEQVEQTESYVRGHFEPRMVIDLARRFRLDAVLVGTVVDYQYYSPQRLSVQMDLVASETGAAIWSSSVQLDASSSRVREALEAFFRSSDWVKTEDDEGWEIALLSPRLFAQFAAWQLAQLL
jgi:hypothetical protein